MRLVFFHVLNQTALFVCPELGVFPTCLFLDIWDSDKFPVRKGQGYGLRSFIQWLTHPAGRSLPETNCRLIYSLITPRVFCGFQLISMILMNTVSLQGSQLLFSIKV